ncbi:MAG: hypothetical protein ABDH63_04575 [Candidatus Caldarchaeales archaeon]
MAVDALVDIEYSLRIARELVWFKERGISTHLSFHPLSVEAPRRHPPILLEVVEEGITVLDDGTFGREARRVKVRMKERGSTRIWLADNKWVWLLKPGSKIGEVIEL